jgi:hypothetical protein
VRILEEEAVIVKGVLRAKGMENEEFDRVGFGVPFVG